VISILSAIVRLCLVALVCLGLGACASNLSATQDMYRALKAKDPNRFEKFEGNPTYQYLEAHSPTSQAMLVLGYVTNPAGQPPIHTWYDADKQLLRLQNGFLVNLTGAGNSVTNTEYVWPEKPAGSVPWLPVSKTFSQPDRQLFNKTLALRHQPMLASEVGTHGSLLRKRLLNGAVGENQKLVWYRELLEPDQRLPTGLYAFSMQGFPVYGSQCLTPTQCVEWLYRTPVSEQP